MYELESKMCMNPSCGSTSTLQWKKGWPLRSNSLVDLCYRCGCAYESSLFCETFHMDQSGWRECYFCRKRLHCGCIASEALFELMDNGGVGCATCVKCHHLNLVSFDYVSVSFMLPIQNLAAERQQINGESRMRIDGGRREAEIFSQPLVIGGDKRAESVPSHGFSSLMNPETTSSYMALDVLPCSPCFSTPAEGKRDVDASLSRIVHFSASGLPQKASQPVFGTPHEASKSAQARMGRSPVEGRGKNSLLSRYWPKYTDKEVQQISGNLNLNIVPLFEKTLSASDAGRIGRLVLPKACAEAYFPHITQSEGIPLEIQDVKGKEWTFQFRYWPNNNSRMYVLEGVTPCIQSMMLQAGDTITFSRVDPGSKLVIGSRKSANTRDIQGSGLTNGVTFEETLPSGIIETPHSVNCSSCTSQVPKESNSLHEHLSLKQSETYESRMCDGTPLVKEQKRTRTIGTKNKRLLLHSEESMELRLTWEEEAQDLLRPSPNAKPTIVVIEEHEFEEFDEPPVFGKRTIITSRPSGELDRWASCDDCSKLRRLPVDALLPSKWICSDNVWDATRCLCSAPEETLKELEDVFKVRREYKKRRTVEIKKAKTDQEPSGLDALAKAAAVGDTIGEPEVAATTTKHPRHKVGCSCIVCSQPPSGTGKHKPNCGCNVCSTVKRRFETLRKKKQAEREAKEVNKGRIDLNSDPFNREDNEQGGSVLGVTELDREAAKTGEETKGLS
ncbi:unnamed protein product [Cochlearia groenlandica]